MLCSSRYVATYFPFAFCLHTNRALASVLTSIISCVAPTRELAVQVCREFEWIAPELRVTPVYGGVSIIPQGVYKFVIMFCVIVSLSLSLSLLHSLCCAMELITPFHL
jgi:hypothetical protein